jgi:hypothetical protein
MVAVQAAAIDSEIINEDVWLKASTYTDVIKLKKGFWAKPLLPPRRLRLVQNL